MACAFVGSLVIPAASTFACVVERLATVPLHLAQGLPLVDVTLDGRTIAFVLDTGAERTVLSDTAVKALGIKRDEWVSSAIVGLGGATELSVNATPRVFEIGGVPLRRNALNTRLSLAAVPLPWTAIDGRLIGGLLGADYLSVFDLDIDFASGTLGLLRTRGCEAASMSWIEGYDTVPLARPKPYVLLAPVRIDGRMLSAELDTGSNASLIAGKGAVALGITPGTSAHGMPGAARGIGRQALSLDAFSFHSLRIGAIELNERTLPVGVPARGFAFDMLLGTDLLRDRHILISYATSRLLVAPKPAR